MSDFADFTSVYYNKRSFSHDISQNPPFVMEPAENCTADDFEIIEPTGTGSFSNVYHAVHKASGRHVALKRLFWNNSPDRIIKEVRWLMQLDHPNVVKLLAMFREGDQATVVLDYIPHVPFRALLPSLKGDLIKYYMKRLLTAIAYVHQMKIIHRDVKPANFLFDPEQRTGCLIDFGLCEDDLHLESHWPAPAASGDNRPDDEAYDLMYPEKCQNRPRMMASRAGTRGFRAPEVLFSTWNQSTLIDVWSAGVVLLSILANRYPFFKSPDDLTAIVEISVITGTEKLREAARECGRRVRFPEEQEGMDLKELVIKLNPFWEELEVDDNAFDLLRKLMEPVPSKRISAAEALEHPFFAGIE